MPLLCALPVSIRPTVHCTEFTAIHYNTGSAMVSAYYPNREDMNAPRHSDPNPIQAIEVLQDDRRRNERGRANSPISGSLRTSLYTPLDTRHPEIRLIQLLPGSEGEPIECSLTVHWLSNAPRYGAVSYVWGDPEQTARILVGGRQQEVTMNLYAFLKHFRNATEVRVLWIDALCINQDNTLEKNHQVGIMGEIYKRCHVVLVWLGTGAEIKNSTQAFHMLRELANGSGDSSLESQAEWCGALLALGKIMESPWWSRAWVVQELLLAPKALFVLGVQTIDWDTLSRATDSCTTDISLPEELCRDGSINRTISDIMGPPCQSLDVLRKLQEWKHMDAFLRTMRDLRRLKARIRARVPTIGFLDLMCSLRDRAASDPRDKVYALLGLTTRHGIRGLIEPDYSLDTPSVYIQSAITIMRAEKSLRLLMLSTTYNSDDPTLPSWVPDWRRSGRSLNYGPILQTEPCGCSYFQAGMAPLNLDLSKNNDLILKGIHYDSVLLVGDIFDCSHVIEQWASLAGLRESWPEDSSVLQRFLIDVPDLQFDSKTTEAEQVEHVLVAFGEGVRKIPPPFADGFTRRDLVQFQDKARIREQFDKLPGCPREVAFYRTLVNDLVCDRTISLDEGDAQPLRRLCSTDIPMLALFFLLWICKPINILVSSAVEVSLKRISNTLKQVETESRRFFVTRAGRMGLGPPQTRVDDQIFLLDGGHYPFLLRPAGGSSLDDHDDIEEFHKLVGHCYVQGIMHGEGFLAIHKAGAPYTYDNCKTIRNSQPARSKQWRRLRTGIPGIPSPQGLFGEKLPTIL